MSNCFSLSPYLSHSSPPSTLSSPLPPPLPSTPLPYLHINPASFPVSLHPSLYPCTPIPLPPKTIKKLEFRAWFMDYGLYWSWNWCWEMGVRRVMGGLWRVEGERRGGRVLICSFFVNIYINSASLYIHILSLNPSQYIGFMSYIFHLFYPPQPPHLSTHPIPSSPFSPTYPKISFLFSVENSLENSDFDSVFWSCMSEKFWLGFWDGKDRGIFLKGI